MDEKYYHKTIMMWVYYWNKELVTTADFHFFINVTMIQQTNSKLNFKLYFLFGWAFGNRSIWLSYVHECILIFFTKVGYFHLLDI